MSIKLSDSKISQNAENRIVAKSLPLLFEYPINILFLKRLYKAIHNPKQEFASY